MKRVLLVGATSAIATAIARRLAPAGGRLHLLGRNVARLESLAADLHVRGAATATYESADLTDGNRHEELIESAAEVLGGIDLLIIAYGALPDQHACELSAAHTRAQFEINAVSVISLLTVAAALFERQRGGTIVVLSSVAGERGRRSNYVYGSAKAAVSVFLEGLRQRLSPSGVDVITVKPGLVDTPMTESFRKSRLWVAPERVADDILKGIDKRRSVIYTPWFWRYVMIMIRALPETLFKRLRL